MMNFLLVCVGGAVGSGARYLVGTWAVATWGPDLPWGTLAVNLVGSFLIGVVAYLAFDAGTISTGTRLFLATGIMGGFTTYSAFNQETITLALNGRWATAVAYVGATLTGAWFAGLAGRVLTRALVS